MGKAGGTGCCGFLGQILDSSLLPGGTTGPKVMRWNVVLRLQRPWPSTDVELGHQETTP